MDTDSPADLLDRLYADLERAIAALPVPPVCQARGDCCDFPNAGHVLYAAGVEVERATDHMATHPGETLNPDSVLCPFWCDGACSARAIRPLGCRLYYCDSAYNSPGGDGETLGQEFHARLQRLHEAHGWPYQYVPFVRALRDAATAAQSKQKDSE